MRTPNAKCLLCRKPLYRRPSDKKKFRYAACIKCRSEAQKHRGITRKQLRALKLGRAKGTNHRAGYKHRPESKRKIAKSNRLFWKLHPKELAQRGEKLRGKNHYNWKDGTTRLSIAIRTMSENLKWIAKVRERDSACVECSSPKSLEVHHKTHFSTLIKEYGIRSLDDARKHKEHLWPVKNGILLCRKCHYKVHGRKYED